jgi:hypothetical protein
MEYTTILLPIYKQGDKTVCINYKEILLSQISQKRLSKLLFSEG